MAKITIDLNEFEVGSLLCFLQNRKEPAIGLASEGVLENAFQKIETAINEEVSGGIPVELEFGVSPERLEEEAKQLCENGNCISMGQARRSVRLKHKNIGHG